MAVRIIEGDCLASLAALPPGIAQTCVTNPPYAAPSKGTGGATEKQSTNAGAFFAARRFGMGDAKPKDLLAVVA